ncbi:hypothetical protein J7T55_004972 [Diaporthe amygdali]|uniref:uncharacterized protein n=1 Tax=Phomopsis amygdali TaxID=1214568 RepID=UPI0022FDB286|nr:uncharacterized protein J7T55_004972 [Diaporthe amygdali]KAJ0116028.1 hypothetical protein J7T55_004972 [Diaporthe amygdali]
MCSHSLFLLIMLVLLVLLVLHGRHLLWSELKMMRRDRPRATRQLPSAHSSASTSAPTHSHSQVHTSPPSYDSLFGETDLETVRAQNPPKTPLNAPIPTDSPIEEAYFVAATALIDLFRTSQDEMYPLMTVALELLSMLDYEHDCGRMRLEIETERKGLVNLIDAAVRQSLAQAPPPKFFNPHHELQSAGREEG